MRYEYLQIMMILKELKELDLDGFVMLVKYLEGRTRYENDTFDVKHNYKYIKSMEKQNSDLDKKLSDSVALSELQNLNETKKRKKLI